MLYIVGRFIFFVLFKLLFGLKVYAKDNIPRHTGFIIASNHASNIDPLVIAAANYRPINFMAKEELFRNKFFGFILRCVHVFPVKRGKTDLSSIKEAIRRLKDGGGLLLFPQGGRQDSIDVEGAKEGIGLLARRAQVPIVSAYINGSGKAMPKGKKMPRRTQVSVYFGQAMYIKPTQDYASVVKEVMLAIEQLSQKKS